MEAWEGGRRRLGPAPATALVSRGVGAASSSFSTALGLSQIVAGVSPSLGSVSETVCPGGSFGKQMRPSEWPADCEARAPPRVTPRTTRAR